MRRFDRSSKAGLLAYIYDNIKEGAHKRALSHYREPPEILGLFGPEATGNFILVRCCSIDGKDMFIKIRYVMSSFHTEVIPLYGGKVNWSDWIGDTINSNGYDIYIGDNPDDYKFKKEQAKKTLAHTGPVLHGRHDRLQTQVPVRYKKAWLQVLSRAWNRLVLWVQR